MEDFNQKLREVMRNQKSINLDGLDHHHRSPFISMTPRKFDSIDQMKSENKVKISQLLLDSRVKSVQNQTFDVIISKRGLKQSHSRQESLLNLSNEKPMSGGRSQTGRSSTKVIKAMVPVSTLSSHALKPFQYHSAAPNDKQASTKLTVA